MTTEMKPLEWVDLDTKSIADSPTTGIPMGYIAWPHTAWFAPGGMGHWQDVPGPYDGTIETAKQRCEEHRRKQS